MTKLGLGPLLVLLALGSCHRQEHAERPTEPARKSELTHGLTKEQSAQGVVKLGARTVTLGEFADRLGAQPPYLSARYNTPERRREFLDELVRFELFAAEAEKRGYYRREDVERVRQQAMVEQMMQELFEKRGVKLSDISDAEVDRYYADHEHELDQRTPRGVIRNRLWRARREAAIREFLADLRRKADVRENLELLSKVHIE